jgi:hypothetical protein
MAVRRRKTRMINWRLTEEEYEALRNLYRVHGSRSMSEFARSALQKAIGESARSVGSIVETRILDLDSKVTSLDHEVARLVQLVESRLDPAGGHRVAGNLTIGAG